MKILFLSIYEINDSDSGYIYADLVREFARQGHEVYAVTPTKGVTEAFTDGNGVNVIKVQNGQIQKTGKIKKVINLLTLENKTVKAVKKFAGGVKFDLIINMSSNLSYVKTMEYFKKRDNAVAYFLLKDIFPQNALDMKMMRKSGVTGLAYKYFKRKEKRAYAVADFIGCMSAANRRFVLSRNAGSEQGKATVCPNAIEPVDVAAALSDRAALRKEYGLPLDKKIFVYGGNLGKPQSVPFIIKCLKELADNENAYFFIVGDGTEFHLLEQFIEYRAPNNVKLLKRLSRESFDLMLASCDVGLIFLDVDFTVPNYPSRLLSYMQARIPVIACTDRNTDVGIDIENGGFGWRCISDDVGGFADKVNAACVADTVAMGERAWRYLNENFTVGKIYDRIMSDVDK